MEAQWPLILFTLFLSWAAGLYGTASIYALKSKDHGTHMPALFASAALMVVGGVAVFFHLEHWERIFNGFGHLSSGITQELIAIIVLAICMVATFVALRKNDGKLPKALAVVNIAVALVLVFVMGLSYMMNARPSWGNFAQVLSLVGNACVLGPATFALIRQVVGKGGDPDVHVGFDRVLGIAGSAVNALTTCVFVGCMAAASQAFTQFDRFFDGIHATKPIASAAQYSPFAGDALVTTAIALVSAFVAAALTVLVYRMRGDRKPVLALIIACSALGAIALRMSMYATGGSVFMYY